MIKEAVEEVYKKFDANNDGVLDEKEVETYLTDVYDI